MSIEFEKKIRSNSKPLSGDKPLKDIIAAHKKYIGSEILFDSIGDGFLYYTNPVFQNIRLEALRLGFRYSSIDTMNYFSFPMLSLDNILTKKTIPYHSNFFWLEELEEKMPNTIFLSDLYTSGLQSNYLLHESAHCVAHPVLFGSQDTLSSAKDQKTLVKIMLSESFANTVDCISSLFAHDEISSYFLHTNTFFSFALKDIGLLLRLIRQYGEPQAIKLMLLLFLYSNFLYRKIESTEIAKLSDLTKLPDLNASNVDLQSTIEIAFSLSEKFRTSSMQLYLKKQGYYGDAFELLDFDPLDVISKSNELKQSLDHFAHFLGNGLTQEFTFN